MKKTFTWILASVMMLMSMTACGSEESSSSPESSAAETTTTAAPAAEAETEAAAEDSTAADTVGQALLADFRERAEADSAITAQEMADALLTNEVILFSGASMPVEGGLLTGFGNAEITGFSEGVMFAPMIGTIPFVGYIFVLEEGSDVEGFKTALETNADPRWNICTEADETIVDNVGNTVFFLMSPNTFEEE